MILTIASGKGGTGKTTLAVNLTEYLVNDPSVKKDIRLLDCDVEAPNDSLFIKTSLSSDQQITTSKPVWNKEKCKGCYLSDACSGCIITQYQYHVVEKYGFERLCELTKDIIKLMEKGLVKNDRN